MLGFDGGFSNFPLIIVGLFNFGGELNYSLLFLLGFAKGVGERDLFPLLLSIGKVTCFCINKSL